MAEVVLYHHSQGLTDGVKSFADELRRAGHTVHTPDLYEGNVYATLDEGMEYARKTGFGTIAERGAVDYVAKPFDLEHLHRCVTAAHISGRDRAGLSA